MNVYGLYLQKKQLNIYPHIFVTIEIIEILPKIHQNVLIFKGEIISLYRILKKLSPKKNMAELKLKRIFLSYLKKQFKKLIKTDDTYFMY